MFSKRKIQFISLAIAVLALIYPAAVSAQVGNSFSLVPCGGTGQNDCNFTDILVLLVRLINLLLAGSAVVTVYYILMSAWGLVTSMGNSEKITSNKEGITRALIGFAMILLSFAFINLLIQGLFGIQCNWWSNPAALWPGNGSSSCLVP